MKIINIILFVILNFFSHYACACYYPTDPKAGGPYPKIPTSITINMGQVTTSTDAVGGVIATVEGSMTSFGGAPAAFACGTTSSQSTSTNLQVYGDNNSTDKNLVYDTNIPGIGIKFYYYSMTAYQSEPTTPTQIPLKILVNLPCGVTCVYQNKQAAIKIELVKTGTIDATQRVLSFSRNSFMFADTGAPLDLVDLHLTATITANTCDVDATSPTRVDLEPADANTLPRKGATTGDTPFEIRLKCTGKTDVNLLLDGQEDTDVTGQGVLAIKKTAESAKGIGLQLLYNDLPVELEKEFSAGMSAEGTFTIPLTARYYRTTEIPVKAGDVSATVVYSLTYK